MDRGEIGVSGRPVQSRVAMEHNKDLESVTTQLLTMVVWSVQIAAQKIGRVAKIGVQVRLCPEKNTENRTYRQDKCPGKVVSR
jgi:hypothetical protein